MKWMHPLQRNRVDAECGHFGCIRRVVNVTECVGTIGTCDLERIFAILCSMLRTHKLPFRAPNCLSSKFVRFFGYYPPAASDSIALLMISHFVLTCGRKSLWHWYRASNVVKWPFDCQAPVVGQHAFTGRVFAEVCVRWHHKMADTECDTKRTRCTTKQTPPTVDLRSAASQSRSSSLSCSQLLMLAHVAATVVRQSTSVRAACCFGTFDTWSSRAMCY